MIWLLSIAAHHCIDQLRKNRINLVSLEDLVSGDISDPLPTPERKVVQRDEQQKVQKILLQLSELDRAAIILYYWYDMSYEEISETLHLSVSSVKSRLHRARKAMASHWREQSNVSGSELERKRYETPVV
jgi:RNA polymerase sigma-70 factor (ECF subfamily)